MATEPARQDPIHAALQGERQAWAMLLADHGPAVYGLCRRFADDPDDAYQSAWERVVRALPRFDPAGTASLRTWILTITHRHLVDRHRRRGTRGTVLPLVGLASSEPDAEQLLSRRQRQARLEAALQRLPDPQRRVVVMHHLHGVPLDDIAHGEGVPVGTVKSRLHRGRARLAELMEGSR